MSTPTAPTSVSERNAPREALLDPIRSWIRRRDEYTAEELAGGGS